jgi:hypothetical protein
MLSKAPGGFRKRLSDYSSKDEQCDEHKRRGYLSYAECADVDPKPNIPNEPNIRQTKCVPIGSPRTDEGPAAALLGEPLGV